MRRSGTAQLLPRIPRIPRAVRRIALAVIVLVVLVPSAGPIARAADEGAADPARALEEIEQLIAQGSYRQGLERADQALASAVAGGDAVRIGVTESLRARLLAGLGDDALARQGFERAGKALAGEPALLLANRLNQANFEVSRSQFDEAIDAYREVADGARKLGDLELEARARANGLRARVESGPATASDRDAGPIAQRDLRRGLGRATKAVDAVESPALRAALALHLARTLELARGDAEGQSADWTLESHRLLTRALADADAAQSTRLRAEALGGLGALYESEGHLEEAASLTDRALAQARRSETAMTSARLPLQAGRIRRRMGEQGAAMAHYAEAVAIVGKPRDESLMERASRPGRNAFETEDAEAYRGLVDLLLRRAAGRSDAGQKTADLREAQSVLETYRVAELRDYFADDCVDRNRESRARVDDAAGSFVVIYPVILEDRLELLVSRRDWIESRTVEISRVELEKLARQYRGLLEDRTTRLYLRPAQALHAVLIESIADLLAAQKPETLVVVPDGILRTIPFSALHDGKTHLIERYALATTPSLELSDPHPFDRSDVGSLYGGLTTSVQGFDALPQVKQELEMANRYLPGTVLLDESFSRKALIDKLSTESFDLVHVASHAEFSSADKGGFLLTHDGKLQLGDFRKAVELLQFRERPLEILILSACETAAGDDRAALGFSGAAVQAGARSVLGSLWLVQDEATSVLLSTFYEALAQPGVSRAEAMRRAQRRLIDDPAYAHPSSWAAFLLINSWL